MAHRLLHLLAIISAALFAAVTLLWIRSHTHHHDQFGANSQVEPTGRQTGWSIESRPGYLAIWYEVTIDPNDTTSPGRYFHFESDPQNPATTNTPEDGEAPHWYGITVVQSVGTTLPRGDDFAVPGQQSSSAKRFEYRQYLVSFSYWLLALIAAVPVIFNYLIQRRPHHSGSQLDSQM